MTKDAKPAAGRPDPTPTNKALSQPFSAYKQRSDSGFICSYDVDATRDRDVKIGHVTYEFTKGVQAFGIRDGNRMVAELLNSRNEPVFVDINTKQQLRWVINATNQRMLATVFGSAIPAFWTGRICVLYHTQIKDKKTGDMIGAIRVRDKVSPHDKGPTAAHRQAMQMIAEEAAKPIAAGLSFANVVDQKTVIAAEVPPDDFAPLPSPVLDAAGNDPSQTYVEAPPDEDDDIEAP